VVRLDKLVEHPQLPLQLIAKLDTCLNALESVHVTSHTDNNA
jgi:hypothetical protein